MFAKGGKPKRKGPRKVRRRQPKANTGQARAPAPIKKVVARRKSDRIEENKRKKLAAASGSDSTDAVQMLDETPSDESATESDESSPRPRKRRRKHR